MSGDIRKAPLVLVLALAAILAAPACASFLTIANAANITRCLSLDAGSLVLEDCMEGIGAEWNWTLSRAIKGGHLQAAGYAAAVLQAGDEPQCLDENLRFRPCHHSVTEWTWDRRTLQLRMTSQGEDWCLGLNGHELLLEHCQHLDGSSGDDQNGYGATAEQTWVLFPSDRPQIRILDQIHFPLRTVGRFIVDVKGRRVKLAGVNWIGSSTGALVNNGLAVAPLMRIVKTIKYMGFNTVRLSYVSEMHQKHSGQLPKVPPKAVQANPHLKDMTALEAFDEVVKAITSEGLLVVLSRRADRVGKCCSGTDGSELWYGDRYTEGSWLDSLSFMAARYKDNERVIGVDLLNEPRLRESNATIPWWGSSSRLNWVASKFGYRFADWRVAASKGAVAVWNGNPNALVIVQGQMYATNLEDVIRRPMKLNQDCLSSRVVFSTHESRWYWPLASLHRDFWKALQPWTFYKDLKRLSRQASEAGVVDRSGADPAEDIDTGSTAEFSYTQGGPSVSYENWVESRIGSAYYLHSRDLAAVWVSEFGTNKKEDNAWWDYMLRYFRRSDISWSYYSLDGTAVPSGVEGQEAQMETYGIFDAKVGDYSRVVGWKLQDLVEIQAPKPDIPTQIMKPAECSFEYEANFEAVQKPTDLVELLITTSYSLEELVAILIYVSVLVLLPLTLLCCCCCCACRSAAQGDGTKAWPMQGQEKSYLALNRDTLDTLLTVTSQSMSTRRARDSFVDAEPQSRPFQTHYPGSLISPTGPPITPDRGLFCCTSTSKDRFDRSRGTPP